MISAPLCTWLVSLLEISISIALQGDEHDLAYDRMFPVEHTQAFMVCIQRRAPGFQHSSMQQCSHREQDQSRAALSSQFEFHMQFCATLTRLVLGLVLGHFLHQGAL